MVPSASTNMMLEPPAPRSPQDLSSMAARSGTKLVSHMWLPGRTVIRSPSPAKYSFLPVRSPNSKSVSKMNFSLWKVFITSGRSVVVTSRARSRPLALKCRCLALSGMANRLRGPHSKLRFLPSANSLRGCRAAWRNVEHEHVGESGAALEVHGGALDPVACPWGGLHRIEIDAEILGDRQALILDPVQIGVDAVARLGCVDFRLVVHFSVS